MIVDALMRPNNRTAHRVRYFSAGELSRKIYDIIIIAIQTSVTLVEIESFIAFSSSIGKLLWSRFFNPFAITAPYRNRPGRRNAQPNIKMDSFTSGGIELSIRAANIDKEVIVDMIACMLDCNMETLQSSSDKTNKNIKSESRVPDGILIEGITRKACETIIQNITPL